MAAVVVLLGYTGENEVAVRDGVDGCCGAGWTVCCVLCGLLRMIGRGQRVVNGLASGVPVLDYVRVLGEELFHAVVVQFTSGMPLGGLGRELKEGGPGVVVDVLPFRDGALVGFKGAGELLQDAWTGFLVHGGAVVGGVAEVEREAQLPAGGI